MKVASTEYNRFASHRWKLMEMKKFRNGLSKSIALVGRKMTSLADIIHPLDDFPFKKELASWRHDKGDEQLKFVFPLNAESVVLDVGGFKGEWAMNIYARYRCTIHILEPVSSFAQNIEEIFAHNENLVCHQFGLSDRTQELELSLLEDGSSVHRSGKEVERVQLLDAQEFFERLNLTKVDLMKINVEGGEFEILPRLIETDLINRVENILVQFHLIDSGSHQKRLDIQRELQKTHELIFCYDFIWENWCLR